MPGWITGIDIDEGGSADVAFEPSPSTVAGWMDEPWNRDIFFNPPARSVRFQVTTATFLTVEAYDAADSLLETKYMPSNWNTGPGGDPTGDYNAWDLIAFTSTHNQIARLNLSGGFNIGSIDDLIIVRGVSAGVDCAPVTRGDTATCKIDAEVDTVLAWEFAADSVVLSTGMSGSWVNPGPTAQLEWEGPAVHSGTVRAEVLQDSAPATLYGRLDVADRPWRWGEEDWSYDSLKPAHTCSDPWPPLILHQDTSMNKVRLGLNVRKSGCELYSIDPYLLTDSIGGGFEADSIEEGPNKGLVYVTDVGYRMDRWSMMNPFITDTAGPRQALTHGPDQKACRDAMDLDKNAPVVVNFWEFNAICKGRVGTVDSLHFGVWRHEGFGTDPQTISEANGHEARRRAVAELKDRDAHYLAESTVATTSEALLSAVRFAVFAADDRITELAGDHSRINGNWCGKVWMLVEQNNGSFKYEDLWLYQTAINPNTGLPIQVCM